MAGADEGRDTGTAWLVTAFSVVVGLGLAAIGIKALLDGYYVIAVFALLATLGIGIRAVARFLFFTQRDGR